MSPHKPRIALIPQPLQVQESDGAYALPEKGRIVATHVEADAVGRYLAARLHEATGRVFPVGRQAGEGATTVTLALDPSAQPRTAEGYALTVGADGAAIRAAKPAGLFYGAQTLLQLLPAPGVDAPASLPHVRIQDEPCFEWRGAHLDVCRHFMPKEFVMRLIDLMAAQRLNVLHWHLTEDQAWRVEIEKYPRLTEVGAWREDRGERHGGFYTKDDVREVLAHARSRHVRVVPEIELPGHCVAALAAYPELSCTGGPFEVETRYGVFEDVFCAGNDRVFEFLEDVLSEAIDLFPGEFLHIGGDECPKARWKECPRCQARIRDEGLADEHELQSWFVRRVERFLNAKGRRLIGWDEILEGGLAPNATVMSWRGVKGGVEAARQGHDVVMTPMNPCYLNRQEVADPDGPGVKDNLSLEDVLAFDPVPPDLEPAHVGHILGGQSCLWTEYIRTPGEAEYMLFPRLCAMAEALWSPAESRSWEDFRERLRVHLSRLDAAGVNYRRPDWL